MSDKSRTEAEWPEELERLRRRIGELEREHARIGDRNETILRTCIDGFWLVDKDGHILEVNDAYCRMSGYTRDELLTMSLQDLEARETAEEIAGHIREITDSGAHRFESRHRRKDGTMMDVDISAHSMSTDGGRIFTFLRDITGQKQAEWALRESEAKYRTLVEHLPAITYIAALDESSTTLYVSPQIEHFIGFTPEEYKGDPDLWRERLHPDDKDRVLMALGQSHTEKGAFVQEYRMVGKDGRIVWFRDEAVIVRDQNNQPLFLHGVMYDITEHKRAEEALRESEEKYRTLVESAGEAIATVDVNGVFTFMNETAAKRLGGAPRDFVGKTMWDLFPKDVADRQAASVREVIKTGRRANVIVPTRLGGRLRWHSTTIEPLKDGAGKVTAALVVARDIHELIQAQEEVRTLSSAVEQSIDGVAIGDVESRLLYVNEAYARMHGYTRQELVGMKTADLYARNQIERYEQVFAQIRKGGSYAGEAWHARKDGTLFPCYVSITLVRNDRGEVTGTVAVCRDMAESKQKEAELTKFRAQMARAEQLASLGTLSATVAHQITQPLTVIRLSLDNVLDELTATSGSSTAIRRLQDSIGQVSNITSIINRFRHFARQSSDTRFGQVSLYATAERVVRLLEESARQSRVCLRLENMDKLPSVLMNETDLEQLFFALLENAIQAADGTKAHHVVISTVAGQGRVELRFSDDCGGIAPENLDRLFEPFFTTKPRGSGTGLGLCIVQDVVTRIGGRIRVESELGKGTTFFVTLPVKESATS